MVNKATGRSLVIIDEFGKGTLASDGVGLLSAVLSHFARCPEPPRLIACTHFHELLDPQVLPRCDECLALETAVALPRCREALKQACEVCRLSRRSQPGATICWETLINQPQHDEEPGLYQLFSTLGNAISISTTACRGASSPVKTGACLGCLGIAV